MKDGNNTKNECGIAADFNLELVKHCDARVYHVEDANLISWVSVYGIHRVLDILTSILCPTIRRTQTHPLCVCFKRLRMGSSHIHT